MGTDPSSHKAAILQLIRQITDHWLKKRYDEIGELLSEDVVIAPPGFERRICGREAYVESYRAYDQSAVTHEFKPEEPEIDIMGETAIAICPFFVVYEIKDKIYREKGHELLVLSRSTGQWQVIWRTMQNTPVQ